MSSGELNTEDLEGLVGRELDDRYLLDRFIDRGGFGVVYRGIDKKFNQPVAIKVGLSYREFMKEAKLAAEVRHNNIVQVSDYGHDKGLSYLVMEFLEGDDLEKLFKNQNNQLTSGQLRKFVAEVGDALAHAHAEQLIHRDLKPRNIILRETRTKLGTSGAARFVLLDFGIAAKLDAQGTQRNRTQDGAGTIEYMAPELLKASPIATQQSDIYAFGTILYQMMMGRVPFPQNDTSHAALGECVGSILHLPPPTFEMLAPDRSYPPAIEELVLQCLEKDPADRPTTMAEVRDRFLSGFPASDSLSAGHSGTFRPDELSDTNPGFDRKTVGKASGQAVAAPVVRRSRLAWWLLAVVCLMVLAAPFAWMSFTGTSFLAQPRLMVQQGSTMVRVEGDSPIAITAGESLEIEFAIDDLRRGIRPEFLDLQAPPGLRIEPKSADANDTARWFTVAVTDLNAQEGGLSPITFRASLPGFSAPLERTLHLEVRRPVVWMPDDLKKLGFGEASGSRLCKIDQAVYASTIERRVGNQTVRLRLVPGTEIDRRRIGAFYVMEQVVTNALFNEFAKAQPGFEVEPRDMGERGWESADDFPATDIVPLEAQHFAQWLAGSRGSLPTTQEWELFSGYYDFVRLLEARFQQDADEISPAELKTVSLLPDTLQITGAEVQVGAGPTLSEFREPGGMTVSGSSPYGCRYLRLPNNMIPIEMTGTLTGYRTSRDNMRDVFRRGIPALDSPLLAERKYSACLRGSAQQNSPVENLWVRPDGDGLRVCTLDDLDDAGTLTLLPDSISRDVNVGFRVVLPVQDNGKAVAN